MGLALGGLLWTCHQPGPLPPAPGAGPHAGQPAPKLPASVHVLLAGQEGQARVRVQHGQSTYTFVREGERVVEAGESQARRRWLWNPLGPFEIGGRHYLGGLEIHPHPETGGLRVYLRADLETYVEGVVAAELPLYSSLPAELEAQAIAVRTYALGALSRQPHEPAFLWDGVQDQAFHGLYLPGSNAGEQRAAVRLNRAIEATRGQVLVVGAGPQRGALFDARYHAACGGITVDRQSVFAGTLRSPNVPCEPCQKRAAQEAAQGIPKRRPLTWEASFSREPLDRLAQQAQLGSRLLAIQPLALDATGRWLQVRLQGDQRAASLSLHALRRALGFGEWKSGLVISLDPHLPEFPAALQNEAAKSAATEANSFSTPIGPRGLTVRGLGRGHGVGLCQEGLHDYAAMGWTSHTILRHYYPGTEVVRLDP